MKKKGEQLFGEAVGDAIRLWFGVIVIVLMVIGFIIMKVVEQVVRTMKQHPTSKVLWGSIAHWLWWVALAGLTGWIVPALDALAVISFLVMAPIAKGVEVYFEDQALQIGMSRGNLVSAATTQPWWNP